MWEPQLRTPGISCRSTHADTETRYSSGADVPGWLSQCIRKSRSLKLGSSWLPRVGATISPASATVITAAIAGCGLATSGTSTARYPRLRSVSSGDSRCTSRPRDSSMRQRAGVRVSATTIDTSTASA